MSQPKSVRLSPAQSGSVRVSPAHFSWKWSFQTRCARAFTPARSPVAPEGQGRDKAKVGARTLVAHLLTLDSHQKTPRSVERSPHAFYGFPLLLCIAMLLLCPSPGFAQAPNFSWATKGG